MNLSLNDLKKEEKRLKTLKNLKPIAEINGIEYYDQDEHQKFLDSVDPQAKVYLRQKDETGKTVFNGVNRVVVDPTTFFAITYWIDEENGTANFIVDPVALFVKKHASEVKLTQVQGFVASYKDGEVGEDFKRKYYTREEFVNNFAGNLYEDDPTMAIELFKTLAKIDETKQSVAFKLK